MRRSWLMVALFAVCRIAQAQVDVGLVSLVAGEVSFAPQEGKPGKAQAFMKVREGDRFSLPAGTQLKVVYFQSSRQERWQGPSSFLAGKVEGRLLTGAAADLTLLPASVPQRIARVPELMQNARLGGIQVRGGLQPARKAPDQGLQEARSVYQKLSKELPADDITAELFLYSALNEYQLYEDMVPVVGEMLRKQPDSEDVRQLADWLRRRTGQ